jgi:hypothetical protein
LNNRSDNAQIKSLFCLIVALVTATASSAQQVNWGAKSALLDLGMTEQQVMNKIGYSLSNQLIVIFHRSPNDGMWLVNGWKVYP